MQRRDLRGDLGQAALGIGALGLRTSGAVYNQSLVAANVLEGLFRLSPSST